jgi:hypothetical protein
VKLQNIWRLSLTWKRKIKPMIFVWAAGVAILGIVALALSLSVARSEVLRPAGKF